MSTEAVSRSGVEVSFDYSSRVNFAFQQNAIPAIRRIGIRNNDVGDLSDVTCSFKPKPAWAKDFQLAIARIAGGSDYSVSDLPIRLNLEYLATLSDRVRGEIEVEVRGRTQGEAGAVLLYASTLPVEVFAYDEWTGLGSLPEILAAFVTPNTLVVEQLLSRTADFLKGRTDSSAIDGYQTKSKKRVYEILDCVFDAVRELGIRYSNPPASFETTGQRVRFCDQIARSKLGTCLDLSLLFAAVMEAVGLRPIVLLHEGHAYVGCWLIESSFPEPSCDDLQSVRKRVDLEEIIVFESTFCCEGKAGNFAHAVNAARPHLNRDDVFQYAVGIFRARASGIRPLPIERGASGIDIEQAQETAPTVAIPLAGSGHAPTFAPAIEIGDLPTTPEGRIDRWKQQLLDLTLRNRLLNFRETKQTIPLVCPHSEQLEDELAASRSFQILEQSKLMAGFDPRSLALQEGQFGDNPVVTHLVEELHARRLRTSLGEVELSRRLIDLYRRSRAEMEESGANTLYLALGFLEWKESKGSDRSQRAPILLIPVRLERKSVHHGFSIQRVDEDAVINVTLLELLKRDFELEVLGVNPPPEDESGVDVTRVLQLFKQAVKDMPGWEVHSEFWLSQFSFSKFLLWKDLHDRIDSLTKNSVVHHLVNKAGEPFVDGIEKVDPCELDDTVPFEEMYCPVSADSSQLAAIVAASKGKNFVMHGPPGTGKSQTITNLIAHSLSIGKRVLFVAEKRAALEVVHDRLSRIGLGPFCLELHSNKTGKADVLRQFGESLDFADKHSMDEWRYMAGQLEKSRAELNGFVRELHRVYPNGVTAYHCYSWIVAHRDEIAQLGAVDALKIDGIEFQSREQFEELLRLCEDLKTRGSERRLSLDAKDALRPFALSQWTPEWEEQLFELVETVTSRCASFRSVFLELIASLGLGDAIGESEYIAACLRFSTTLVGAPSVPGEFVQKGDWNAFRKLANSWVKAGKSRDAARERLTGFDLGGVLTLSIVPLKERYELLAEKGGPIAAIRKWFLLKPVRKLCQGSGHKLHSDAVPEFFKAAQELQAGHQEIELATAAASLRLGEYWNGGEAKWDELDKVLEFGDVLHSQILLLVGDDVDRLGSIRAKLGQLLPLASDMFAAGMPLANRIEKTVTEWKQLSEAESRFRDEACVNRDTLLAATDHLARLEALGDRLTRFRGSLQSWARWQFSYQAARAAQMGPILDAVERQDLSLEAIRFAFEARYRECFLKRLISLSETLRDFWGDEHDKRILAFNDLDDRYTNLSAQAVAARLASELPKARGEDCPRNTELGILQRERAKKARHKPVRRLFSEIPSIVPKLKPCFLMSPLSVAQYLDVSQDNFDIVVFDEASQIPVWDAVGAIARGKQVIVVGDPKQLPPTNFFGRSDSDESAIDDGSVQDLESILDECLGSGLDIYHLRWHYRSRNEGLIAFSNHHYYENGLLTFPSPDAEMPGVRLVSVPEGFYDKGKSRTNRGEAEAIKKEVVRRLKDPKLCKLSIGIVTFSQAQQTLVLDKMDEARREHPEIESFFGDEAEEPVFVKNLENVQGDERDVIIFSICYGPEQSGKVSMNFGPLNRPGGERRLNVAVTRAKHEIIVFSTLRSDQIDLTRTRAKGAEHLKAYLEYAERGPRALALPASSAQVDAFDSLFEKQVAELLRSKGYDAHTQIGCSGYRIDLAVLAPNSAGRYLIGIECDGASYHRAATARDRDRLRQAVLEGLGWKIHRIWSTDWWRDHDRAVEDLLTAIEEAQAAFEAEASEVSESEQSVVEGVEQADVDEADLNDFGGATVDEAPARYASPVAEAAPVMSGRSIPYPEVALVYQAEHDIFYEPDAAWEIQNQMIRIIEAEGPILESLLMRRVSEEWRFGRAGGRIRTILNRCFPSQLAKSMNGEETVFWPSALAPADFDSYRTPTEQTQSQRTIEEIPLEELQNAAMEILDKYISFPREDFMREVAKRFGITRLGKNVAIRLEETLGLLSEGGKIVEDAEVVKLAE